MWEVFENCEKCEGCEKCEKCEKCDKCEKCKKCAKFEKVLNAAWVLKIIQTYKKATRLNVLSFVRSLVCLIK